MESILTSSPSSTFSATTNDGATIKVISKFLKTFHKRGPVGMIVRKSSLIFLSNDTELGMAYRINLDLSLFNTRISSYHPEKPSYIYISSDNFSGKTSEIRKKDTITISTSDGKFFTIVINKPGNKSTKLTKQIKILDMHNIMPENISSLYNEDSEATVTVETKTFMNFLTSACKLGSDIRITSQNQGMKITADDPEGPETASFGRFEDDDKIIYDCKFDPTVLKKVTSLKLGKNMSIYTSKNEKDEYYPLHLKIKAGEIGIIDIFINPKETNDNINYYS